MMINSKTDWTCPACGGAWVRSFEFEHGDSCEIGRAEDTDYSTDYLVLKNKPQVTGESHSYTRPCTVAEMLLAHVFVAEITYGFFDEGTEVVEVTPGVYHRTVDGVDPDHFAASPLLDEDAEDGPAVTATWMQRVDQIANRFLDDPAYATEPGVREDIEHLLYLVWRVQTRVPGMENYLGTLPTKSQIGGCPE